MKSPRSLGCTDNCSLKNVTEEMGTSSNDELSANATSGNRRLSEDVSLSGRAMSDQNSVAQSRKVIDLKAEYVGVTSVNLSWTVNDTASDPYTYRIEVRSGASINNETSNITEIEISGLTPGTPYNFTVFAVAADGETEGEGASISLYTKPSAVLDLKADYVGVTSVSLTWMVNDTASASYTYRIEVTSVSFNGSLTSNVTMAEITGLIPGTSYNFKIFAVAADNTEGEEASISLYTKPSPVLDLKAEYVGVTSVNLTWTVNDTALTAYTYRIEVRNANFINNETSNITEIEITGLIPGTSYNFKVFATPVNSTTEEEGLSLSLYTSKKLLFVFLPFLEPSPVLRVMAEYVGVTSVNLSWTVNDTASDSYTYRIEVRSGASINNETSNITETEISGLTPGTPYNFTVFAVAADGETEGEGASISLYTKPTPVFDLKAEYIGVTSVNLNWTVNDTASDSYTYRIEVRSGASINNETSSITEIEITGLTPGTPYNFTVFAVAADGETEGEGASISLYTKPNSVLDLEAEYIGVTSINLNWMVNDTASDSYTYRIEVRNGASINNETSNITETEITGLTPGTPYNFTVFAVAADGETEGEGASISLYTKPSSVLDLKAEYVAMTSVNLTWMVNDAASASYTYRIEVARESVIIKTISNVTESIVINLIPGTSYNFTVFAIAADNKTVGEGASISQNTIPSSVSSFQCEAVANTSYLTLQWDCPYGGYSGFDIEIFNDTWTKNQQSQFCGREGSEGSFKTEPLDYYKTYTVNITTVSEGLTSLPVQIICNTSITDPPVPNEAPVVKAVSHNSLSVEFPDFESANGPLKAYAVMIITEAEGCWPSKSDLSYTYNDFKQKMTATYVTYVIEMQEMTSFNSQNGQNIVDVGKGNTMYGYENGPLIPLHSYRASIAGFTNINFTEASKIMGEQSYVSFSPCSEVVSLPQDPGIVNVGLAVLHHVVFFSSHRKDKRNTEVSFSPIKSKMIKVENFESYFKKQQADSNCGFAEEYEELKSAGVHQPKFAAEIPENRGKNRYNNVLPYDISRVKLSNPSCATDDYINANYMPGYSSKKAFIAAQGPLPNTIEDFWRMIWEKNIYSVVMLTKCVEQARTKCEQYWPDKQSKSYGDVIVTMISEVVLPEWTIRDFNVENADTLESHTVRQFHFTSWPDHGVPETTDLLINFRHLVHEYSSQNPIDSPILVHCSAGVGRTGTFIAIDRLIQQIEMENTVDVYGVVYDLRMHRPLMVQTEDQYVFLNQCVMDIIRSQKEKKTDLIYQNTTAMAIYENFTPGTAFGKANGYHA
uniref:Receptor-type tyrosine-protein phosphatase eta n=1 Tax=Chrysolophus pictus TaxID=9089 RepID=A0A8C3L1E4_CHRPC